MKTIGILALQGDFEAHEAAIARAGAAPLLVRETSQFGIIDGLIIPGGESTTMIKLLHYDAMIDALKQFGKEKPVFGTCAGAVLMATQTTHPAQESLGMMDMTVERNAYGRQNESRIAEIEIESDFQKRMNAKKLEAIFIRAPIIRRVGVGVKVLALYNGDPVLVEEGLHMAATYHPELTKSSDVHRLFISKLGRQ
ncbi:MAG: pyridoxal 5'-phosphate synthase glutaminase subunit PdxT [Bdellovibrionales bacterium]